MITSMNTAPITAPNFNKAFKSLQRLSAGALLLLGVTNLAWAYAYFTGLREGEQRVYVVSDGGTVSALLTSKYRPTVYEARNHIRNFTTLMHAHDAGNY